MRRHLSLRNLSPFVALVGLVVVFGSVNPRFLTLINIDTVLRQASVLLIISLASTFAILMASIDLSVGAIATFCAIATALFLPQLGYWVLLVAPLIGLLFGVVNGMVFVHGQIPSFLTTLGTMSVMAGLGLIISHGMPIVIRDAGFKAVANGEVVPGVPNIALWAVAVYAFAIFLANRTRFGRYIYAIGGGERVAVLAGVPVGRYKIYCFMISGLLAGLAGVLLASRVGSAAARLADSMTLDSVAAVVMGGTTLTGGVGGPHRTLLGVAVIAVLSNGMNVVGIHPYIQTLIQGLIVIVAVAVAMDRSKVEVVK